MFELFEKYSCTIEDNKGKVPPIKVRKNINIIFDDILKFLREEGYEDISSNKEVYDIYCIDYDFEISILLVGDDPTITTVNMTVYNEKKRGKTRRYLRKFRSLLVDYFKKIYQ